MQERRRDNKYKVFVKVRLDWDTSGKKRPLLIKEDDGPTLSVDKVKDVRPGHAQKGGGHGMRYTCMIGNQEVYLYLDGEYWFIERDQLYGLYGAMDGEGC